MQKFTPQLTDQDRGYFVIYKYTFTLENMTHKIASDSNALKMSK